MDTPSHVHACHKPTIPSPPPPNHQHPRILPALPHFSPIPIHLTTTFRPLPPCVNGQCCYGEYGTGEGENPGFEPSLVSVWFSPLDGSSPPQRTQWLAARVDKHSDYYAGIVRVREPTFYRKHVHTGNEVTTRGDRC